jgi:hypothetical protein
MEDSQMTRTGTSTLVLLALTLALSVGGWGCARQRTDSDDPSNADSSLTSQPGDSPPGTTGIFAEGHDSTGSAPPDTSSPVGGALDHLRDQLRAEALRLDRAVHAGKLDEAYSRALRVRDVVVALNGKTAGLPDQKARQIESDMNVVIDLVEKVRARAAAGDAAGLKAQNAELQGVVARIIKVSGPGA